MSGSQKGKKKKIKMKGKGLATIRGEAATIATLSKFLRSETPISNQNTDPQYLENEVFISYPGCHNVSKLFQEHSHS